MADQDEQAKTWGAEAAKRYRAQRTGKLDEYLDQFEESARPGTEDWQRRGYHVTGGGFEKK